jgi:hypothetical protein
MNTARSLQLVEKPKTAVTIKDYPSTANNYATGEQIERLEKRVQEVSEQNRMILKALEDSKSSTTSLVDMRSIKWSYLGAGQSWPVANCYASSDQHVAWLSSNDFILLSNEDNVAVLPSMANTKMRAVPLPKLLFMISVCLAVFCSASIITWLSSNAPLMHPIISIMGLVSSPFIYWMGRLSKLELEKQN